MSKISVVWFRKGLRLHDNRTLRAALQSTHVLPIFVLDPHFVTNKDIGPRRWNFLLECLRDLDVSLQRLKSRLFIIRGKPEVVLEAIFEKLPVTDLHFEKDTEPYARERDERVASIAKEKGVHVHTQVGHTLYDPDVLLANYKKGKSVLTPAPTKYQSFLRLLPGNPEDPIPPPKSIPSPLPKTDPNWKALIEHLERTCGFHPGGDKEDFSVPDLPEIGREHLNPATPHRGGESEALRRLAAFCRQKKRVCLFEKPKTSPTEWKEHSTTVLSPYLKHGALSVREFHHRVSAILEENPNHSKPPESLLGQLYWREFYYLNGYATPNYAQMLGNPICLQTDWRKHGGDSMIADHLERWKMGRTGYPFIDAIMIQLRTEGWIHHLARHVVACFLCRVLYIHWEYGERVFSEFLLDADWSLNVGNWLWLSTSAFFTQYFRVYSPVAFPRKTDKNGDFVRHYIPALAKVPARYIYEPWEMPVDMRKNINYPGPMVDFKEWKEYCMGKLKEAYRAKGAGENLDGDGAPGDEQLPQCSGSLKQCEKRALADGDADCGSKRQRTEPANSQQSIMGYVRRK